MISSEEIREAVKKQLSYEFNCSPEDFEGNENIITLKSGKEKHKYWLTMGLFKRQGFLLKMIDNIKEKKKDKKSIDLSNVVFFIIVLVITISGNLLYWAAYYPGGFNLDAYGQWMQINGDLPLNNWHPFFITGFSQKAIRKKISTIM